ncbi:3-ketoacyl-coa synthase [Ancistrocladus abbreviatus]
MIKVYLVNFTDYKHDPSSKTLKELFMSRTIKSRIFLEENVEFQRKLLERSRVGQETYFLKALLQVPPNPCMEEAKVMMMGDKEKKVVGRGSGKVWGSGMGGGVR